MEPQNNPNRTIRNVILCILIPLVLIFLMYFLSGGLSIGNDDKPYFEYYAYFRDDKVETGELHFGNGKLTILLREEYREDMNKDGKVDENIIKRFIAKVVPVGNNTFEWYIDLDKKHHAKAILSTTGRKNNSTIKLEEISAISPSFSAFLPLFQNSPLSTTSHRLPSRVNGLT